MKNFTDAKEQKEGKHYKRYDTATVNCAWTAFELLRKGKYYYYRKGVLVPNEVLNDVADVFGAKVKSLK